MEHVTVYAAAGAASWICLFVFLCVLVLLLLFLDMILCIDAAVALAPAAIAANDSVCFCRYPMLAHFSRAAHFYCFAGATSDSGKARMVGMTQTMSLAFGARPLIQRCPQTVNQEGFRATCFYRQVLENDGDAASESDGEDSRHLDSRAALLLLLLTLISPSWPEQASDPRNSDDVSAASESDDEDSVHLGLTCSYSCR